MVMSGPSSLHFVCQGFEARGTTLSNRLRTYENLLDQTQNDKMHAANTYYMNKDLLERTQSTERMEVKDKEGRRQTTRKNGQRRDQNEPDGRLEDQNEQDRRPEDIVEDQVTLEEEEAWYKDQKLPQDTGQQQQEGRQRHEDAPYFCPKQSEFE